VVDLLEALKRSVADAKKAGAEPPAKPRGKAKAASGRKSA
jgi:non-homologous end joining protein Ku